jgi:aryl-alcohol dehydrogenase-like predicted oxidoreductase/putative NADH-flavin reductase
MFKGAFMRYRQLGRTGLYVSELCLGTMTFGGKGFWEVIGNLPQSEVEAFFHIAFEAGVNFIDTADAYSEGQSETLIGQALASMGTPREQLVLGTKVRLRTGPGQNQIGLSRAHIMASVDASLRRLKMDYIDLYQIHGLDRVTPIEETLHALNDLVHTGKVRYIGFCNLPAWYAMKAVGYSEAHGLARFVSAQMYYSIASRDIEREIVPLARDQKLAILPWSPLAGGLLSGKFEIDKPGPAGARRSSFDFPLVDKERARRVLAIMRTVADEERLTVAQVALGWLLTRPFVTSVILGAKTRQQLSDNLTVTDIRLDPMHVAQLDAASGLPAEYPGWMVNWQDRDRRAQGIQEHWSPKNILLFGATGMIGRRILAEAIRRGHRVTAVARNTASLGNIPGVNVKSGNILDPDVVAGLAYGQDVVVSAVGPKDGDSKMVISAARSLIQAFGHLFETRLIVVNGAGSLEVAPGRQLLDTPEFPAEWKQIALAHRDALDLYRSGAFAWTCASPAAYIEPGDRTGRYRLGVEELVTDKKGNSRISAEDFAVAVLDEIEQPRFIRRRFTAAY